MEIQAKRLVTLLLLLMSLGSQAFSQNYAVQAPILNLEPLSDVEVRISWVELNLPVDTFVIERKPDGGAYTQVATIPFGTTSYVDASLSPATHYTYRISALTNGVSSGWGKEVDATTFQTPPAGSTPYLQRLTILNDCLIGGGTTTGEVRLSQPATTDTVVQLGTNDANVTLPSSVTVQRGSRTATFSCTIASPPKSSVSEVFATLGSWIQAHNISSFPTGYQVNLQLYSQAITNGVRLYIDGLNADMLGRRYSGIYVQKRVAGGPPKVLSINANSLFCDTTSPANVSVTYLVSIYDNQTGALYTIPLTSISGPKVPYTNWTTFPTGTLSGDQRITLPKFGADRVYRILVDGRFIGSGYGQQIMPDSGLAYFTLSTGELRNGTHVVQAISDDGQYVTAPRQITTCNPFQEGADDGLIDPTGNPKCKVAIQLANPATYQATLRDEGGNFIKSWSGFGNVIFAIDNMDTSGRPLPEGYYSLSISSGVNTVTESIHLADSGVQALSMAARAHFKLTKDDLIREHLSSKLLNVLEYAFEAGGRFSWPI